MTTSSLTRHPDPAKRPRFRAVDFLRADTETRSALLYCGEIHSADVGTWNLLVMLESMGASIPRAAWFAAFGASEDARAPGGAR